MTPFLEDTSLVPRISLAPHEDGIWAETGLLSGCSGRSPQFSPQPVYGSGFSGGLGHRLTVEISLGTPELRDIVPALGCVWIP